MGISVRGTSEFNINISMLEGGKHSLPLVNTVYPPSKHSLPESSLEPSLKDISNENEKPVFIAPPKTIKPKSEITNAQAFPVAKVLAEVTGLSYEVDRAVLYKEARALLKDPRINADLIRNVYSEGGSWYKNDWRGKQGQMPGLYDIRKTFIKLNVVTNQPNVIHGGLKNRPIKEKGGLKVNG
jgi:hypothetical protein